METVGEFISRYERDINHKSNDEALLANDVDMSVNSNHVSEEDDHVHDKSTVEALKAICLTLTSPTVSSCSTVFGAFCERLFNQFKLEENEDDDNINENKNIPPTVVQAIARIMSLLVIRFHKCFVTGGGGRV